jgi:hypothetical protein
MVEQLINMTVPFSVKYLDDEDLLHVVEQNDTTDGADCGPWIYLYAISELGTAL